MDKEGWIENTGVKPICDSYELLDIKLSNGSVHECCAITGWSWDLDGCLPITHWRYSKIEASELAGDRLTDDKLVANTVGMETDIPDPNMFYWTATDNAGNTVKYGGDQVPVHASTILTDAAKTISNRAVERDKEEERSMLSCVNSFNALTKHTLTEEQGWLFMVVLKMARAQGGAFKLDDYLDGAAYFALAGEAAAKGRK